MQPKKVVRLTIPASAMLQQYALGYYFRQNLLPFLYTPKYADNKQDWVFRDYTQAKAPYPPLQDNHVFLYNRPQHAGGKGGSQPLSNTKQNHSLWMSLSKDQTRNQIVYFRI